MEKETERERSEDSRPLIGVARRTWESSTTYSELQRRLEGPHVVIKYVQYINIIDWLKK